MRNLTALAVSLSAGLLFTGCGPMVNGSGRVADEVRPVAPWTSLQVASGIHAEVVKGDPSVTLTADDNLFSYLDTVVEGDTLIVRVRPGTHVGSSSDLKARVFGEVLEGAEASGAASVIGEATPTTEFRIGASGSSEVRLTALNAGSVRIDSSGSSTVTASGEVDQLRANASGSSDVNARNLVARTAQVDGSGASSLVITATQAVTGNVSGASRLTVFGGASMDVESTGGSSVTRGD